MSGKSQCPGRERVVSPHTLYGWLRKVLKINALRHDFDPDQFAAGDQLHVRGTHSEIALSAMPPFMFRCPRSGYRVQGYAAEEVNEDDQYLQVTCNYCRQVHFVNPANGQVLGEPDG
jgi:hypothetical protein